MASTIRNTTITWGLSEFPVALKKASEKQDVTFERAVKRADGTFEKTAAPVGGRSRGGSFSPLAEGEEIVYGVWTTEDTFHEVPASELEKIKDDTQIKSIEIDEFIPLKDAPWERVEGAYYLTPTQGLVGGKSLRLLRDAMKAEKAAATCKLSLKATGGRQKLAMIHESEGRVMVSLLAFAGDFRDTTEAVGLLNQVEVNAQQKKVARELVRAMMGNGTLLAEAKDDAVSAREKLYEQAIEGKKPKAKTKAPVKAEAIDDVMEAMKASLAKAREKVPA